MKFCRKFILAMMIIVLSLIIAQNFKKIGTVEATNLKLNKTKQTVYEGNTYTLKVKGTNKKLKWSSSNKSVATVNSDGKVTGKNNGTANITAKIGKKKLQCKVTVKLFQFDTNFYSLEKASKEYRYTEKIKNYKDFNYDLDGDGIKDKITIKYAGKDWNGMNRYYIQLNGKTFLDSQDEYSIPDVYIVDLNKDDKKLEVIMHVRGPNDIQDYIIFEKKGSKMNIIKDLYGSGIRVDKKGKILVENILLDSISPQVFDRYYEIKNGKITTKKVNMNKVKKVKFRTKCEMLFTKNMKNLDKYFANNFYDSEEEYPFTKSLQKAGIYVGNYKSFNITKFTDADEAYVKLSNGKKGYLFHYAYHLAG